MRNIVILSGGFDPIHSGHISMIAEARRLAGDDGKVIVGVNSGSWLNRKKGHYFLTWNERANIIRNIVGVDEVMSFNDDDDTARNLIELCVEAYRSEDTQIIFANGGDRVANKSIPEEDVCNNLQVKIVDGVGGFNKANSSSDILKSYIDRKQQDNVVERPWGKFTVIHDGDKFKAKILELIPGESISKQYHRHRNEYWIIVSGTVEVYKDSNITVHTPNQLVYIPANSVHKVTNIGKLPAVLVEVQTGEYFGEDDIIRLDIR